MPGIIYSSNIIQLPKLMYINNNYNNVPLNTNQEQEQNTNANHMTQNSNDRISQIPIATPLPNFEHFSVHSEKTSRHNQQSLAYSNEFGSPSSDIINPIDTNYNNKTNPPSNEFPTPSIYTQNINTSYSNLPNYSQQQQQQQFLLQQQQQQQQQQKQQFLQYNAPNAFTNGSYNGLNPPYNNYMIPYTTTNFIPPPMMSNNAYPTTPQPQQHYQMYPLQQYPPPPPRLYSYPSLDSTTSDITTNISDNSIAVESNDISKLKPIPGCMAYSHPLIPIIPSASGNTRKNSSKMLISETNRDVMIKRLKEKNETLKEQQDKETLLLENKGDNDDEDEDEGKPRRMAFGSPTWTKKDDQLLRYLKETEKIGWRDISMYFPMRTINACQFRWRRLVTKDENKRKREQRNLEIKQRLKLNDLSVLTSKSENNEKVTKEEKSDSLNSDALKIKEACDVKKMID